MSDTGPADIGPASSGAPGVRVLGRMALLLFAACTPSDAAPDAQATGGTTAPAAAAGPATAAPTGRLTFEAARKLFTERGVQPGAALPPLSLVDPQGNAADLAAVRRDRPLLLVTCSLTCNVARRRQPDVAALRERFGDRLAVVMLYTVEAHPQGDPCPYTGEEWVPPDNRRDDVLVRQPTTLADRLALARRYAADWAKATPVFVDTIDDASWRALGQAPNVGLLVDRDGTVRERQGWFDGEAMAAAVQKMLP